MKALISTRPRRAAVAVSVWLIATVLMAKISMQMEQPGLAHLETGELMKRLVVVPGLAALVVFLFSTAAMHSAQAALVQEPAGMAARTAEDQNKPFVAQVVGMIWLNPLQRMDYPTEWQLLWTQGFVKPNKNDDMVRTKPEKYSSLRSIGALVYGNDGEETFKGFYHKYVDKFPRLMSRRYAMNAKYFYSVGADNRHDWRELAGIRIEGAVPERLDPVIAHDYLKNSIEKTFFIGNRYFPTMWSRDTPPDVHITQGGANAGFTSLNNALDYLQQNPDKSVWAMNWDAPNFPPTDAQINENLVVLFLAGSNFNTEREPLAWIGKAAVGNTQAFARKVGTTRAVQAWKATIDEAARNGGVAGGCQKFCV